MLDGLSTIRIAVGYKNSAGDFLEYPPQAADDYEGLLPVYEEMPGWTESTADVTNMDDLPKNARAYVQRIETLLQIPIDILSTGPERDSTIILRNPFDA